MASNRNSQNGIDNIYKFGFLPSIDIYYETGKWEICGKDGVIELLAFENPNFVLTKNICDGGPAELDELIKLLIDDASLAVTLSSNGDLKGDDAYNLTLSEKRDRAATEYLIAQGISPSRILKSDVTMAQANKRLNDDESTELDNQKRGRTEFKLLKYNPELDL